MPEFVADAILKVDEFSLTSRGHLAGRPDQVLVCRDASAVAWWAGPMARYLLHREAQALRHCRGLPGIPELVLEEPARLVRTWIEGRPMQVARPADAGFYRDASRLLRSLRRCGLTHNDLAKPQNWIVTPDGKAALIDLQLARRHRRRGWRLRVMAYEDLRHLMKHKRLFAPELVGARGRRLANQRSLPGRIWRATGKRLYEFVTRRLLHWSDREGLGGRAERDGPQTEEALLALPGVRAAAIFAFPRTAGRSGLCAVCEAGAEVDADALMQAHRARGGSADLVLVFDRLPGDGRFGPQDLAALLRDGRRSGSPE